MLETGETTVLLSPGGRDVVAQAIEVDLEREQRWAPNRDGQEVSG